MLKVPFSAMTVESAFVDSLLQAMTLAEKIGQLNLATPGGETLTGSTVNTGVREKVRTGRIGSIFGIKSLEVIRTFQDDAMQSRLKIPLMFAEDVIHGQKTIFPLPLALAASWDPALWEQTARVAAIEASAMGIDQVYAPVVDVCRDPRWGRMAESPGEDTVLASRYAEAVVRGFQGADLSAPDATMACLKHFAAYGAAQAGRDYAGADMSPATFQDVYLPPFLAGIAAGAGSMMAAFNTLNGVPMHMHQGLIAGLLRGRIGFEGLVVSDYTGVNELIEHNVAADRAEAARRALAAGVDFDMVGESYLDTLEAAVTSGLVDVGLIDAACRRVLLAKVRLGLFEDPYRRMRKDPAAVVLGADFRALARRAVAETSVLLKNENGVLPLARTGTVALVGALGDDRMNLNGTWAVSGRPADVVTIRQGMEAINSVTVKVARGANLVDDADLANRLNVHDWGTLSVTIDERSPDELIAEAVATAEGSDVVVAVVGEAREYSGESSSRTDLKLSLNQRRLVAALKATGKPLVLVVMAGRTLVMPDEIEAADAVLLAWFGGTETGHGLADVLFGATSPSGRLPVTLPHTEGQLPLVYGDLPTGRPFNGAFKKFLTGYLDVPVGRSHVDGLLPFGHGLTYGRFRYGPVRIASHVAAVGQPIEASVMLSNEGEREASEVVQLYVSPPPGPVSRPRRRLADFQKVHLKPGESREVRFVVPVSALSRSNAQTLDDLARVVDHGTYGVFIGPDAWTGNGATVEVPVETASYGGGK